VNCALETHAVSYRDAEFPPVELISLCAHQGELLVVLGDHDAGVNTLIRLLAGVIAPTAGRVVVNGRDAHRASSWLAPDPRHFASGPKASTRALFSADAGSILLLEEPTERVDAYEFHKTLARCRQRADAGDLVVLATKNAHLTRIPRATIALIAHGRLEAWGDRSLVQSR
jgi:ABC-type multidrug transport system ATPase subunit